MNELIAAARKYAREGSGGLAVFYNTTEFAAAAGQDFVITLSLEPTYTEPLRYPVDVFASYLQGQMLRILKTWPNFPTTDDGASDLVRHEDHHGLRIAIRVLPTDEANPSKHLASFARWIFSEFVQVPIERTDLTFVPSSRP